MKPPQKFETNNSKTNLLLREIRRRGRTGRLDLAKALNISNSRVCDLVERMLASGHVVEHCPGGERRGRRGVPLMLDPGRGYFIGFDMEALRMRLVAVDFAGRTLWECSRPLPMPKSRAALLECILSFIDDGLTEIRRKYRNILGIGLAAFGVLDAKRGVILHYDLIAVARDLPLREMVATRTGLPCSMDNNIRALTLAEWMNGAARDLHSFVCFAARSGIGIEFVINGKLHLGSHGLAGEAGFIPVRAGSGRGEWKYLHQIVSETALGVDVESPQFTLPDPVARRAGELLGAQLAGVAAMLDPQAIVLAGGLLRPDRPLWEPLTRTFKRLVPPEMVDRVQLLPAQLGPYAAAVGAAHGCFEMLYPL